MLYRSKSKTSLGLSFCAVSLFSAPAQDLLETVPELPPIEEPSVVPENLPPLPELGETSVTPVTPSTPAVPTAPTAPAAGDENPFIPQLPASDSPSFIPSLPDDQGGNNSFIPSSEFIPGSSTQAPGLPDSDPLNSPDLLTSEANEDPTAPSFLEGNNNTDSNRSRPEALQGLNGTSFNGQVRDADTEGLSIGVRLIESYTSNLNIASQGGESTLFTQLSPSFSYRSAPDGRARFIIAATYTPTFSVYHSGAEGNTLDHELEANLTYEGERLVVGFGGAYSLLNAANRFTGNFSRTITNTYKIDASYELSEKTSIFSALEYQTRAASVADQPMQDGLLSGNPDSTVFSYNLSALWNYSPKLRVGPALRYANNDSDALGSASSIGLGAEVRYDYSAKTSLAGTIGFEQTSFPGQSDEILPTGTIRVDYRPSPVLTWSGELRFEAIPLTEVNNIGNNNNLGFEDGLNGAASDGDSQVNATIRVNYRPSQLWSITGSFSHRTAPSFTNVGQNIVDTSFDLAVNRTVGRGFIGLSLSQSFTDFQSSGNPVNMNGFEIEDQEFRQIRLNYTTPSLYEQLSLTAELSYSESTGNLSFDQTQASISLGYTF